MKKGAQGGQNGRSPSTEEGQLLKANKRVKMATGVPETSVKLRESNERHSVRPARCEGHLESKERFPIQRYLLIIGKKQNMQVL